MHTNDRSLTMVDLFCCAGATARLVSETGSEELSRVIASGREVLTRVLMAGDEVQPREWLRADSGSDSLSARVVAGLAHFLSSGVQLPTADYGTLQEHLTTGITHPEKVNPSRGSNSASRSSGHSGRRARTSVSQACGSRPLRFAVSRRLIICAARFPASKR